MRAKAEGIKIEVADNEIIKGSMRLKLDFLSTNSEKSSFPVNF